MSKHEIPQQPAIGRAKQYPAAFKAFWDAYPRHSGASKWDTFKSYQRALGFATHGEILAGLRQYPFNGEAKYQPHPSTWLNQHRWEVDNHDIAPVTAQPPVAPATRGSWRSDYDGGGAPSAFFPASRRARLDECDLLDGVVANGD